MAFTDSADVQRAEGGEGGEGLKRTLGFPSLVFYGVGSMLGAGIYGLIGEAAKGLGSAVWAAFLVAMVGAMLTGLSYASLGSRYPRAGGASYICGRAFRSPMAAYVIGLILIGSGLASMATTSNVFASNLARLLTGPGPHSGGLLTVIAIGAVVAMGLINFWGLRESAALNTLCTVIEAGGLLAVVVLGLRFWGDRNLLELPPGDEGQARSFLAVGVVLMQGAVLTFFSFIGFEDMLNVSEEAKDAERTIPRALVTAQVVAVVVYLLVAVTAVSVLPWRDLAASRTPLADAIRAAAPGFPDWVIPAVTCFAVLNTALLNYVMGSRVIYGMARDGLLPRWLGRLHPSRRTPWVAILLLGGIVLGLRMVRDITQTASASVLLLLLTFVAMNVSLVILKRRPGEARGRFEIPTIVPVLGAVVCLGLIAARATAPGAWISLVIAGGFLGIALLLYVIMGRGKVSAES